MGCFLPRTADNTTICKVIAPQFIMLLMMTRAFTHSSCVITPFMSRNASPTWFLNHPSLWRAYAFLPLHWHSAETLLLRLPLSQFTELSGRWSTSTTVCTHVCTHTHPASPSVGVLKREGTYGPHVLPGSGRLFTREVKLVFGGDLFLSPHSRELKGFICRLLQTLVC